MDITLNGYMKNVEVTDEGDDVIIRFVLDKSSERSVLRKIKCYVVTDKNTANYIIGVDTKREICVDGTLCGNEDYTDFQVHAIYYKPEKIYA